MMTAGAGGLLMALGMALVSAVDGGAPPAAPVRATDTRHKPAVPKLLPTFVGGTQPGIPESYDLRPAGDGSGDLLYEEVGFEARVAPDGSVKFGDKHVRMLKLFEPFLPQAGPRNVPSLFTTLNSLARNRGVPTVDDNAQTEDRYLLMPNLTPFRPDPREGCRACVRPFDKVLPMNAGGRFDLTDELMRFNAQDPYRFRKAKFLAGTRDVRSTRAAKTHAENLRQALEGLPVSLQQIACDGSRSLAERRAIIERLRAELDGASPASHDAAETITRFLADRFASPDGGVACP